MAGSVVRGCRVDVGVVEVGVGSRVVGPAVGGNGTADSVEGLGMAEAG